MSNVDAKTALKRLAEGNQRHVAGEMTAGLQTRNREDLLSGQQPWAVVLSCADSRVIPEEIFDCGAGKLFVVRVAGNVCGPTQIASIEYAVEVLKARAVIVLGHSRCGAIEATLTHIVDPKHSFPSSFPQLFSEIAPSLRAEIEVEKKSDIDKNIKKATKIHAQETARRIAGIGSFRELTEIGELVVEPAYYSISTGKVDML